jgi:hypothetical protein
MVTGEATLTIVPGQSPLVISGRHGLRATSRVRKGVFGQEADSKAKEVMLRRSILVGLDVRAKYSFRGARGGDVVES